MFDLPQAALASQESLSLAPLRPATADASNTLAPNCGVNPPGNIFWKVQQLGLASNSCHAAWSVTTPPETATLGQPAEPSSTPSCASRRSPTSRNAPSSSLVPNTPLRVFGFRK